MGKATEIQIYGFSCIAAAKKRDGWACCWREEEENKQIY